MLASYAKHRASPGHHCSRSPIAGHRNTGTGSTVSPRRKSNPPILWDMGDVNDDKITISVDAKSPITRLSAQRRPTTDDAQSLCSVDSGCATNDSGFGGNHTPAQMMKSDSGEPIRKSTTTNNVTNKKTSTSSLLTRPFTAIVRKLSRNNATSGSVDQNGLCLDADAALSTAINSVSSLNITSTGGDSGIYGGTLSSANTSQDHLEGHHESDAAKSSLSILDPTTHYRRSSPPLSACKYVKNRFKFLPPPLKHMKKKSSCPSLFGTKDTTTPLNSRASQPSFDVDMVSDATSDRIRAGQCRSAGLTAPGYWSSKEDQLNDINTISLDSMLTTSATDKSAIALRMTRFKLIHSAANVPVCRLEHARSMLAKLGSSKLLRRWEPHNIVLTQEFLFAETLNGSNQFAVHLSTIEDIDCMEQLDSTERFCLRLYIADGSLLLRAAHLHSRQQWMLSINWRRAMLRYKQLFNNTDRPEIILTEIINLVRLSSECRLQDDLVHSEPVSYLCLVLNRIVDGELPRKLLEPIIINVAPLLETLSAIELVCPIFSQICRRNQLSERMQHVFENVAAEILKRNMDFGNYRQTSIFVQEYLTTLLTHEDDTQLNASESQDNDDPDETDRPLRTSHKLTRFVKKVHSPNSTCPHGRVLPNLSGVCLSALQRAYRTPDTDGVEEVIDEKERETVTTVFCAVIGAMCELPDWRAQLAHILQPLPFPESAQTSAYFAKQLSSAIQLIGTDPKCEVHLCTLAIRSGKCGWLDVYCPSAPSCHDNGKLFSLILDKLLTCCCKRKNFMQSLLSMLGPLEQLAAKQDKAGIEALCFMLEMDVIKNEGDKLGTIRVLQSTWMGREHCLLLCDKMHALIEMQQRGGPSWMALPSKSTDHDLAVFLSYGFGNLKSLCLAFTSVTSGCADVLIRLPKLEELNLWCTQFGDKGVQLICEHLEQLHNLNLCETPTTDKGLLYLTALRKLRVLNLNSTKLTQDTYTLLKTRLPDCQMDIAYTEAWPTPASS